MRAPAGLFLFGLGRLFGFRLNGGSGLGFADVALDGVAEGDDERFVCGQLAGDLLGLEGGELVGERDTRKAFDLPSAAVAGEARCERLR